MKEPAKSSRPLPIAAFASIVGLILLLDASGSTLQAASACYTENCGTCDNGKSWSNFTQIVAAADFGGDAADTPIAFVDPGDGLSHRFLATQEGVIWVWNGTIGSPLTVFLNLDAKVLTGGERGLLSMAFDPDYATTGEFYVYYTRDGATSAEDGDIIVERYHRSAGNSEVADTTAEPILFVEHSSQTNHNGGSLLFGPDGMLYVSIGDGGGGCDDDVAGSPNGQKTTSLLGKLLRLDVRGADPGSTPPECDPGGGYGVPTDNPLAGATSGCGELWAYGLRNPFRTTVDRENGDFWIGDVGQDNWEEIDLLPGSYSPASLAEMRNFGWRCREGCGPSSDSPSSCSLQMGECTGHTSTACEFPTSSDLYDPLLCHSNPSGWASIVSGYRYRGTQIPSLLDRYLYADVSCGQIWQTTSFDPQNPGATTSECWDSGNGGLYQFAEDHVGELYTVLGSGTGRGVYCIHNGSPDGCYWANWGGIFEDDFESPSHDTSHWSQTAQ